MLESAAAIVKDGPDWGRGGRASSPSLSTTTIRAENWDRSWWLNFRASERAIDGFSRKPPVVADMITRKLLLWLQTSASFFANVIKVEKFGWVTWSQPSSRQGRGPETYPW